MRNIDISEVLSDVFAETKQAIATEKSQIRGYWFVVGHTINGGRFYSEPFWDFEKAVDYEEDLEDIVKFFGGGTVEILRISDYDYDVVSIIRI